MSNWDTRWAAMAGIAGAVTVSAAALVDWVVGGLAHEGLSWAFVVGVHVVGYTLVLPATLAVRARYAGMFGRVGRAAATVFAASFAVMTVAFLGGGAMGAQGLEHPVIGALAGGGFVGMFLGALVLGVVLWRRTDVSRLAAMLLVAPLPLVTPLVAGLDALGVVSAHPAAMEIAVYLGVATLAYERLAVPARDEAARQPARG